MRILEQIKKMKQAKRLANEVRNMKADDVLHKFGLEVHRSAWNYVIPALGVFVAGMVLGAGVALLLTPVTGQELREELNEKIHEMADSEEK